MRRCPSMVLSRRSLLLRPVQQQPTELLALPETAAPEGSVATGIESLIMSRATFGWTPELESEVMDVGWEAWLDQQLAPDTIPDPAVTTMLSGYRTLQNTNQANYNIADTEDDGYDRIIYELRHATFLRAVFSKRQLYEVMVDFWNNHFNVFLDETGYDHLKTVDDRTVARAFALGKFSDLLSASVHSPAMLVYLDNARSNANSPDGVNENYGRELLELHTLGIIDGEKIYTEADVVGVARVLSGWSINGQSHLDIFRYRNTWHFSGAVSLLGGAWSCPAHSNTVGQQYGESLISFLAHHPRTAQYLSWKLCKRFVGDDPPPALVASMASVYLANDTAIAPVLRHLFHSAEFAASAGAKLRRGFELAAALCRVTAAHIDPDPLGDAAQVLQSEGWGALFRLGQRLFGHRTPDGYSDDNADWLSADGLLRRWETAGILCHNWYEPDLAVDLLALLPSPLPATSGQLLDVAAARLLGLTELLPAHGFGDIPAGIWYESGVRWARSEGVVDGFPDGTYRAKDTVNRAQIAMMLWHAAGDPGGSPPHGFSDVPGNAWYGPGLDWAKAQGIVDGFPDGTYRPKDPVNRGQVAMMLWESAGHPAGSPPHGFPDVPNNAWYGPGLSWAKAQGLVSGFPDGTYHPRDAVNRAQIAMMLYRLHYTPSTPLSDTERAAFVEFLEGEDWEVDEDYLGWKGPDLAALLLSTPHFQHR